MPLFVYHRVSTDEQDFAQQHKCVADYLKAHRINPDRDIKRTVVEKISGTVRHTERQLAGLLATCKNGDTVYFSELSRLGRNMTDLNNIVTECCERGIVLIQCKDGMKIENETIGGKALLFALSLAAEIEVANIRQRTNMGLSVRKERAARGETWISNTGRECSRLGRPADYVDINGKERWDVSAMVDAASKARQDAKILWAEQSKGYRWVAQKVAEGWPRKDIIEEFNKLHEIQPDVFCTRDGKPLTKAVLSKWCREMNPLAV